MSYQQSPFFTSWGNKSYYATSVLYIEKKKNKAKITVNYYTLTNNIVAGVGQDGTRYGATIAYPERRPNGV